MLPHVLDFNAADEKAAALYAELAPDRVRRSACRNRRRRALVARLAELPREIGLPTRLSEVGVGEGDLPMLAADAMKQTRLLPNNPREVGHGDAMALYKAAY